MTILPAKAQTPHCSTTKIKEKCDQALKDADDVIRKQGQLISLVTTQNNQLIDENQQLSNVLVEMKQVNDSRIKDILMFTGGGVLVGILAGILVSR